MSKKATSGFKSRMAVGVAAAVLVLGVPSASLAVNLLDRDLGFSPVGSLASFTPASADPRLARMIEARGNGDGRMMRFTPAGASRSTNRAVTVAVRVDAEAAQAISVRSAINSALEQTPAAGARIAPSRYNLGIARGYRSFAQAPAVSQPQSTAAILDLSEFAPTAGVHEEPSRFAAHIALEEEPTAASGTQTLDSVGDQSLDVAGSYRLTRNLDVTAGVRFQQDRARLSPLPNVEQLDSQAVYIGTQFRF